MIAYKFLAPGSVGPFTGYRWEPDRWVEADALDPCRRGIHACRVRDLPIWLDAELWEIELHGDIVVQDRKLVASRGRLTRRIDAWTPSLAQRFGASCARRTRVRFGHLPQLSGFVGDIERFVAGRRIPIAGFAAARAAELAGGPAGYEAERLAQSAWLAGQLGLERV